MSLIMKRGNSKILLIFPPVWDTDTPYLSLPQISSFLEQNDVNCSIYDANIYFWDFITSNKYIQEFVDNLNQVIKDIKYNNSFGYLMSDLFLLENYNNKSLDQILASLSDSSQKWKFRKAVAIYLGYKIYSQLVDNRSSSIYTSYHDQYYNAISLSDYSLNSKKIDLLLSRDIEIYRLFFNKIILKKIESINPEIIGFSIIAPNQVIPTMLFSKYIKERLPNTKIVCGGSWCTLLKPQIVNNDSLYKYVDMYVYGEGEKAMLDIANLKIKPHSGYRLKNISYKFRDKIIFNNSPIDLDINLLPTPNFDEYELKKYDNPNTLPLQYSRGCGWGKCRFCSYSFLDNNYKLRKIEHVINDINKFKMAYDTKHICFTDSMFPIKQFIKNINSIKVSFKGLSWQAFAKNSSNYDFNVFAKLRDTGCKMLIWGVESGSKEVLRNINKNVSINTMERNLVDSTNAKIHNRVCLMYGIPSETSSDMNESILFLRRNVSNIQSIAFSRFTIERNTEMFNKLYQNGDIELSDSNNLTIGFPTSTILSNEELISYYNSLFTFSYYNS